MEFSTFPDLYFLGEATVPPIPIDTTVAGSLGSNLDCRLIFKEKYDIIQCKNNTTVFY